MESKYPSPPVQNAYLKGATARLDNIERDPPYTQNNFRMAWCHGWDEMDRAVWNVKAEGCN